MTNEMAASQVCSIYPCDKPAYTLVICSDTVRLDEAWWSCDEHIEGVRTYVFARALGWGSDTNVWTETFTVPASLPPNG